MTNLICWNCRGFKNKWGEIKNIISDHQSLCIALQETYLKQNDKVVIRGLKVLEKISIMLQKL